MRAQGRLRAARGPGSTAAHVSYRPVAWRRDIFWCHLVYLVLPVTRETDSCPYFIDKKTKA